MSTVQKMTRELSESRITSLEDIESRPSVANHGLADGPLVRRSPLEESFKARPSSVRWVNSSSMPPSEVQTGMNALPADRVTSLPLDRSTGRLGDPRGAISDPISLSTGNVVAAPSTRSRLLEPVNRAFPPTRMAPVPASVSSHDMPWQVAQSSLGAPIGSLPIGSMPTGQSGIEPTSGRGPLIWRDLSAPTPVTQPATRTSLGSHQVQRQSSNGCLVPEGVAMQSRVRLKPQEVNAKPPPLGSTGGRSPLRERQPGSVRLFQTASNPSLLTSGNVTTAASTQNTYAVPTSSNPVSLTSGSMTTAPSTQSTYPVSSSSTFAPPLGSMGVGKSREKAGTCPQGHPLTNLGTSRDDGWDCDARNEIGGCRSGITSFNQTAGMQRHHCSLCAYDLCERCFSASLIEATPNAEAFQSSPTPKIPTPRTTSVGTLPAMATLATLPTSATISTLPPESPGLGGRRASLTAVGPPIEVPSPLPGCFKAASRAALCADPRGPMQARVQKDSPQRSGIQSPPISPPAVAPEQELLDSPPLVSIMGDAWHADWSIRIGTTLDGVSFAKPVMMLDLDTVFSVNQAVEGLNRGAIQCNEDFAVAYSASSVNWFLLFKNGRQDLGLAALGTFEAKSNPEPPQPSLAAGAAVKIGGLVCKITTALGMGSFGAVWAGECLDSKGSKMDVAVKEIHCQSPADLQSAMYEGKLLEIFDKDRDGSGGACGSSSRPFGRAEPKSLHQNRIPAFVATDAEELGPSYWRVRLAMSKVPGVPLDNFLEMRQRDTRLPPRQRFSEACHFTSELISQLSPAFEHISSHALHRDVNSHNILIDGGDTMKPSYGLVDFGLAVDMNNWRGPGVSTSSWHLVDIGGDCRYWPMAAWLQFEGGFQELTKYPPLAVEYETQLDFHALGITALQVWTALAHEWRQAPSPRRTPSGFEGLPDEVTMLHYAWQQYWKDATYYWQRLLECFRNQGDQNALKGWCISEGVHNVIGQHLADLRSALRKVCDACSASAAFAGHLPLFEALLELISAGGVTGVHEGRRPPSWQGVRSILEKRDVAGADGKLVIKGSIQAGSFQTSRVMSNGISHAGYQSIAPADRSRTPMSPITATRTIATKPILTAII